MTEVTNNIVDRFETRRLTAERLRETHLDDLLAMDRDPRVMNTMGGARTEDETREYLNQNLAHWDEHGFGIWILRMRDTGELVGRAYLRRLHIGDEDEIALGYALIPDFWGIGLATEIASEVVDVAFSRLGLERVVAGVLPENRPSHNVVEKIGGRFYKDTLYKGLPHVLYRIERDTAEQAS